MNEFSQPLILGKTVYHILSSRWSYLTKPHHFVFSRLDIAIWLTTWWSFWNSFRLNDLFRTQAKQLLSTNQETTVCKRLKPKLYLEHQFKPLGKTLNLRHFQDADNISKRCTIPQTTAFHVWWIGKIHFPRHCRKSATRANPDWIKIQVIKNFHPVFRVFEDVLEMQYFEIPFF